MSKPFRLLFNIEYGCYEGAESLSVAEFLCTRLALADVARLPALCERGCLQLDGRRVKLEQSLAKAALLSVSLPGHVEEEVNDRWVLLWQNSELMALFKPHCLPVSRTTRNLYRTLISLVRRQTSYHDARLLHRLDAETAGVILLAKDAAADRRWKPRLKELMCKKIYHAWVEGVPSWQSKLFECALSERKGSAIRSQVYVVDMTSSLAADQYLKPRPSKTLFRVLRSESNRTLLACQLLTGRKHQIRAQLSYLGHPIVGDKIYAHQGAFYLKRIEQGLNEVDFTALGSAHHLLQSAALTLDFEGDQVEIVVPPSLKLSLP